MPPPPPSFYLPISPTSPSPPSPSGRTSTIVSRSDSISSATGLLPPGAAPSGAGGGTGGNGGLGLGLGLGKFGSLGYSPLSRSTPSLSPTPGPRSFSDPIGPSQTISKLHTFSQSSLGSFEPLASPVSPSVSRRDSKMGPTANLGMRSVSAGMSTTGGLGRYIIEFEDDEDPLHTLTPAERKSLNAPFDPLSVRGWANALTLIFIGFAFLLLFAGYPIISFYRDTRASIGVGTPGYNLGGINGSGQYPYTGLPTLIDPETPMDVYKRTGSDGEEWNLVFSDEFNKDGRTFYNGDDPFFEAVDLHYWPTNDFEWYDPSAITTQDGHLVITMTQEPIHDLNFKSGMLQSWNKLCFNTNAYFEVSTSLPGSPNINGWWPGIWTMGNLGRPGYGGTTDGMWPYTYDSCDIGTLPNQTYLNGTGPEGALFSGKDSTSISFLPGQRTSACTCKGEDHPGPKESIGRGIPEIDMLEAQIDIMRGIGQVSQSFQTAPFDDYYQFNNLTPGTFTHYDPETTVWNNYLGGVYQQAISSLTDIPRDSYWGTKKEFTVFGFEYKSNKLKREDGYVTWYVDGNESWTLYGSAVGPNDRMGIGQRLVSEEPMALVSE
ncbi:hypothetical protein M231_06879 [Tremella mesenterica]|uniref:GH16 domain-containing protein n=1 Tax=Tremella mesenterica TaxID=5217 RepID=A0A4Q1BG47_TREME|nr:hypothetical protein M231_06879 [Tremella mesenterica]